MLNSVALNGGDAAIVCGTCDAIRERIADAHIIVFSHRAGRVAAYYPEWDVEPMVEDAWPDMSLRDRILRKSFVFRDAAGLLMSPERSFFKALHEAEAVVYVGGGYVSDNYRTTNLFRVMQRTVAYGTPHMAYAQSFGPFYREDSRAKMRAIIGAFAAVTTRDEASLELLKGLGVSGPNVHFTGDAAFSMRPFGAQEMPPADRRAADEIESFRERGTGNKVLLVSVRRWTFPNRSHAGALQERFHSELKRFVAKVLDQTEWKIVFLSTCQGRPEYNYDDSAVAADMTGGLAHKVKERVFVSRHPFHPRSYPLLIDRCADFVVAMRMHLAILTVIAGVPLVTISYEQKSRELMRQAGLDPYCVDAETVDGEALFKLFVRGLSELDGLKHNLRRALRGFRSRSMENADILAGIIGRRG